MADLFNIGVTGMQAQTDSLAVIGNNIANSSTCGFKTSSMSFTELYSTHLGQYSNGIHNQVGNGVETSGVTSDWSTGSTEGTGDDANIAITGDGFLPVALDGEIYYTRAGNFSLVEVEIDATTTGYVFMLPNGAVLLGGTLDTVTETVSIGGADPTNYLYFDSAPTSYAISSNGEVTAEGANVVNEYVGVQRFNNPDSLEREEGGLYKPTSLTSYNTGSEGAETPAQPGTNGAGTLLQGSLEASNTDLVSEFSNLIQAQRGFQACSKVITIADELLQTVLGMIR